MEINVSQLLQEPIGTTRSYPVHEELEVFGDGASYCISGEVDLVRTHRSILVKGKLHTDIELTCSRCLRTFNHPLELNIEEEFVPTIDVHTGVALPPPDEPGTFTIDDHHIIDLAEAIRQYALMTVPIKPLCWEDCAGLCPTCGQDLNDKACHCAQEKVDPRWAELLKQLK